MPVMPLSGSAGVAGYNTAPSWAPTGYGPATGATTGASGPAGAAFSQGQQYAMNLPLQTAQANLNALGSNEQLAATVNATNQLAQIAANQSRLGPEGTALQGQVMGNAQAGARGEITPSELRTFQDISAQQWGGAGFGVDNPAQYSDVMNRYLRTQYQREQDAANTLAQLYAENPSAPIYGLQDQFLTPGQFSASALSATNALTPPVASGGTPRGGGGITYLPSAGSGPSGSSAEQDQALWNARYPSGIGMTGSTGSAAGPAYSGPVWWKDIEGYGAGPGGSSYLNTDMNPEDFYSYIG